MDRPFLQTPEWLRFQEHLGHKVWRISDGFLNANIIQHNVRLGQNYLYIPYGPELNLEEGDQGMRNQVQKFIRDLRALGRHEGSMFIKIEPTHGMVSELLFRYGLKLRRSNHHMQPAATLIIELTQSLEVLLDQLHHKTRYNIGLAERKGVTVESSRDIDAFWHLLRRTAEHDDFRTFDLIYYKKLLNFFSNGPLKTELHMAYHGGRPIAGALMMEHGRTVHYLHGASDRDQRALMGPQLLHWKLIQHYKQRGFSVYDFWGIDADRWPGVTRFKRGFGGRIIEYPGSFDLVLKPFWRWLYKFAPR